MTEEKEWLEVLRLVARERSSEGPDPYPPIAAWDSLPGDLAVRRSWKKAAADAAKGGTLELYVHIPFCNSVCSFCNVEVRRVASPAERERYVELLETEASLYGSLIGTRRSRYVFVGGGTPNLLEASQIRRLLTVLRTKFLTDGPATVVMEVNPEYLDEKRIKAMREGGVSILSIGVESLDADVIGKSGRTQTVSVVKSAYFRSRKAGFDRIIIDMLAGLPCQSEEGFIKDVREVASWRPDEVCMEVFSPENTGFSRAGGVLSESERRRNEISLNRGFEVLRSLGYHHRANESFASLNRGEQGCRPYRDLFDRRSVLGLGLGSLSHVWGQYWARNSVSEDVYLSSIRAGRLPVALGTRITPWHEKVGYILNSLGRGWVSGDEYESIFQEAIESLFQRQFSQLSDAGLVRRRGRSYYVRRVDRVEHDCARLFYKRDVIRKVLGTRT